MKPKPIIIAYDVSCHKRRRKVHRILKDWRVGGQLSLHECYLTHHEAEELFIQLGRLLKDDADHLLMAWLDTRQSCMGLGSGKPFHSHPVKHFQ